MSQSLAATNSNSPHFCQVRATFEDILADPQRVRKDQSELGQQPDREPKPNTGQSRVVPQDARIVGEEQENSGHCLGRHPDGIHDVVFTGRVEFPCHEPARQGPSVTQVEAGQYAEDAEHFEIDLPLEIPKDRNRNELSDHETLAQIVVMMEAALITTMHQNNGLPKVRRNCGLVPT